MNPLMLVLSSDVRSGADFVVQVAKSISDYGALVVIAAVFLVVTFLTMRRILNSYSKTIDGIIPKLSELTTRLTEFQQMFNETMSSHNAHNNQSLRILERDSKEAHQLLLETKKSLKEIEGELNVIRSNYDILFRMYAESQMSNRYNHPTNEIICADDLTDNEQES